MIKKMTKKTIQKMIKKMTKKKMIFALLTCCILFAQCKKEEVGPTDVNKPEHNIKPDASKSIASVTIKEGPKKVQYVLNEALDLQGMVVEVTYEGGEKARVTSIPKAWATGFSSKEASEGLQVSLKPERVTTGFSAPSFQVKVLPLVVKDNHIVKVVASTFTKLEVPEGITAVEDEVFGGNASLEEVVLPKSLTKIGSYAFFQSKKLKVVDLSKTQLTELPTGVFEHCTGLEKVMLPPTLKTIGSNAFLYTSSLTSVNLPKGLEEIGLAAFSHCGLESIQLPNTLTQMKRSFYACEKLKKVTTFGDDFTITDDNKMTGECFQHCEALEVFEIPASITDIEMSILGKCKVKSITIPAGMKRLQFNAFGGASSLKSITFEGTELVTLEDDAIPANVEHIYLPQEAVEAFKQRYPQWSKKVKGKTEAEAKTTTEK